MLILFSGCRLGPEYRRPALRTPDTYRGDAEVAVTQPAEPKSFADLKWWDLFGDTALQDLIRTALQQNYDLRVAAERVIEARALIGVARANQFPSLDANAGTSRQQTPSPGSGRPVTDSGSVAGDLSWEFDFWGKFSRSTEAARADYLATEAARLMVFQSLVTDVAAAYFELLELDWELEVARNTLASRQASLRLVQIRQEGGVAGMVDVRQAEGLVVTAAASIPDLERRIALKENQISILIGENPHAIVRGRSLLEQDLRVAVPPGLPSELLERRPDLVAVEHQLIAANAGVGVAKSAFFPRIVLTGTGGAASVELGNLVSSGGTWGAGIGLNLPIFNAGRLKGNLRAAEARREQAILLYQQAVQQAFSEVSDALVQYQKNQETLLRRSELEQTLRDQSRLSQLRYQGGVTSYLEVLDSERQHFNAQLELAQARRNQLLAIVGLYRALGGGWESL